MADAIKPLPRQAMGKMIGDGVDASLGRIDYTPYLLANARASERMSESLSQAIEGFSNAIKERRDMQDAVDTD